MIKRNFASDNHAGVHPRMLQAITSANEGHVSSYGSDSYTEKALASFKSCFGEQTEAYFVFNGTAANVLSLSALTRSYHSVICARAAHVDADECGAPEKFLGCKLVKAETVDGKLTVAAIAAVTRGVGDVQQVQPRAVSIAQTTELGTVYTKDEIRAIANFCHERGMYLHMDGARISNAAAALDCGFKEMTTDLGVDILSFGGTKIGMLAGEAVVILNQKLLSELGGDFKYLRKQGMQLASKMRFISAQFLALLEERIWLESAKSSNAMAALLAKELSPIREIAIARPVHANAVFALFPKTAIPKIWEKFLFYVWDENEILRSGFESPYQEVRLMTAFDTRESDVHEFVQVVKKAVSL